VELTHRFTVPATLADTWAAFNDIESVAGCFPGAVVTSVEGDDFTGTCKVKLGPIALVYGGTGTFTSKDEAAGTFALEAKGKDKRGNGTAGANVTAALTDAGGGSTEVEVVTDLHITGKPAQFGRGVIQDVSDKLLNQFVACLEEKLQGPVGAAGAAEPAGAGGAAGPEGPAGAAAAASEDAGSGAATVAPAAAAGGGQPPSGSPAPPDSATAAGATSGSGAAGASSAAGRLAAAPRASGAKQDDALDLGATVLPILAKAYWKQAVGLLLVLLLLRRLLRRR
jgi:carbon monoxide dehydrogenase subunit G